MRLSKWGDRRCFSPDLTPCAPGQHAFKYRFARPYTDNSALASDGAFEVQACLRCDEWQSRTVLPDDVDDVIILATYLGEVKETIDSNGIGMLNPPPWYESAAV